MRFSRLLFFLAFALSTFSLSAQDTHFTLHNYAPLWINPANTGSFSGSIRAGGVHRGQWFGIDGIQTSNLYADAPLAFGFRKQDWVGVGFNFITDDAGGLDITSTFFGFSGSYHLALDKKRTNIITLGVQYGSTSYSVTSERRLNQQATIATGLGGLEGTGVAAEFPVMGDDGMDGNSLSYNDLNAGVKLKMLLDAKKDNVFEAGVSLLHLNNPDRRSLTTRQDTSMTTGGSGGGQSERPSTLHAHARLDLEMSEKWRFQPTVFFQQSAGTSSLSLQTWGARELKKDLDLRLGLGYRTGDAAKVMVGFDTDRLRAALAYDITLSQARDVTSYQGAFELGLAYIFNIYKKPEVTPTILCPRL
ncbi:type IX secretion system membrane protein PorP/SprF [Neolewinella aurantiaca]|uniref:Type IX secretion system membrane protein PorP/SprF n=1 Tax=Neolewinella aurantiaca TaxID=2602767 RepID=A0A5C7FE60_9BACT|nr:PorP/SprF family type IX secretion system membrane protein [Neolewinella aurantiaca]TXF83559.1 type IX secretion system membrane protein PorP/SprF [Neolewinella aurantiaca]